MDWNCWYCQRPFPHARFLVAHLRDIHNAGDDPEARLLALVDLEGDQLEREAARAPHPAAED